MFRKVLIKFCMLFFVLGCGDRVLENDLPNRSFNFIDNLDKAIILKKRELYSNDIEFKVMDKTNREFTASKKASNFKLATANIPSFKNGIISIDFKVNNNNHSDVDENVELDKALHFKNSIELIQSNPLPVDPLNWVSLKGAWEIKEEIIKVPNISEENFIYPTRYHHSQFKSAMRLNPDLLLNKINPFKNGYVTAEFKFGSESKEHFTVIKNDTAILIDEGFHKSIGVCFRMSKEGDGYALLINVSGDVAIIKINSGLVSSVLSSFDHSKFFKNGFNPNIAHKLHLFIDGKNLSVYFDNRKILSNLGKILSDKYTAGHIGVLNGFGEETILKNLAYVPSLKPPLSPKEKKINSVSGSEHFTGFTIHTDDENKGYLVKISDKSTLSFEKSGKKYKKVNHISHELSENGWHTLKAVLTDNKIGIFIDNNPEMLLNDLALEQPLEIDSIKSGNFELKNFKYSSLKNLDEKKTMFRQIGENVVFQSFLDDTWETGRDIKGKNLPLKTRRVKINRETRDAILAMSPNVFKYNLTIPSNAFLNFAYSIAPRGWKESDGVFFSIRLERKNDEVKEIFSKFLNPKEIKNMKWFEENIDLSKFANENVNIFFETKKANNRASENPSIDEFFDFALWGEPAIYTRRRDDQFNVILISIDTLRADRLGSYGYFRDTSPFIDSFAKEGSLFLNTIAQAPYTTPSHLSLFTSLYPSSLGFRQIDFINNSLFVANNYNTLAEILKVNGYLTAAFTGGGFVSADYGFSQGFSFYNEKWEAIDEAYANTAAWFENHKKDNFFLFFHTYEVHEYSKNEIYTDGINPLDKVGHQNAIYDGNIKFTDQYIGLLLHKLKKLNILDKTLIIITSDHGEEFWDHGLTSHGHILYDEMIRVPLIMRLPGIVPPKKVVTNQVRLIDIFPTILDILDIPNSESIKGKSLTYLFKQNNTDNLVAFSEGTRGYPMKSIRTGTHKYIYWLEGEELKKSVSFHKQRPPKRSKAGELYDLINDPQELKNIVIKEKQLALDFKKDIDSFIKYNKEFFNNSGKELKKELKIDEETKQRLRALGYIQ